MARAVLSVVLAMALVPTQIGCGTFTNCLGADKVGPRAEQGFGFIYGGVYYECLAAKSLFGEKPEPRVIPDIPSWVETLLAAAMLAVDMPLSAIGDTLTLPYTIRYTLQCRELARQQEKDRVAPAADRVGQDQPVAELTISPPTDSPQ
jgi:hypothetical protein